MTFLFLTPLYNDWESLKILLKNINQELIKTNRKGEVVIVNDFSTTNKQLNKNKLKYIKKITILNLNKNIGSQRSIFLGLKYITLKKYRGILTILDSDGEDDVKKINLMIKKAQDNPSSIILASRTKRLEGFFLQLINKMRLFINYILTGNFINFGNFSSFNINILKKLLKNNNLWVAYSSGVLKNYNNFIYINSEKKKRYFGNSKVNLKFLIKHSLNIFSIYWKLIIFKSLIFICIVFFLIKKFFFITVLILFFLNILIFLNFKINYNSSLKINYLKNIKIYK